MIWVVVQRMRAGPMPCARQMGAEVQPETPCVWADSAQAPSLSAALNSSNPQSKSSNQNFERLYLWPAMDAAGVQGQGHIHCNYCYKNLNLIQMPLPPFPVSPKLFCLADKSLIPLPSQRLLKISDDSNRFSFSW